MSYFVDPNVVRLLQDDKMGLIYLYPTDAAEEWIRRVKAQTARPILFPEWPRLGNYEEGQRIHNLHLSISSRESACVAPIGLAWEESLAFDPGLQLHK